MLLVIPGPAILRIFAITGMDRMVAIFASLDEALAEVGAAADSRCL